MDLLRRWLLEQVILNLFSIMPPKVDMGRDSYARHGWGFGFFFFILNMFIVISTKIFS